MNQSLLLATASLLAIAGTAQAKSAKSNEAPTAPATTPATTPDDGTAPPPDITVTATRRETTLQRTPVTVTALSGEDLAKYNITRVEQVAAQTPNFYAQPGVANASTISLSMRGHGDNAGGFGTTEQPVSFYFDDVYQARPSAVNQEFADIERIEVLRGPQGTLFGRNSMVGAVNIISRTPGADPYGSASISYGNFETFKAKAAVGLPIAEGFSASISGVYTHQGKGYMHDLATGDDIDRRDFWGVRGKLHYYDSDHWDVVLSASHSDNKNDGFVTSPYDPVAMRPLTGSYRDTISPLDSFGRTKTNGISAKVTGKFDLFTVRSITAYSTVSDGWLIDLTGGMVSDEGQYVTGYSRLSTLHQHQWSQETQIFGDAFNGKLNWIGGIYLFHEQTKQAFDDNFYFPTFDIFIPVPTISYKNTAYSYAGYAQLGYKITSKLELTVGGRYTLEDKSITGHVNPTTPYGDHTTFHAFTPKFLLNYQATPNIFLYGSISKGFKAGGYTSGSSTVAIASTPFRPESVWAYEIGAKTSFFDHKVRLNLAAFRNDFSDILSGRFLPNSGIVVLFNGESYRAQGLEMELSVHPLDGLDLYMNGGVQKASHFKFVAGSQITVPVSIPNYSGTTGFRYEFPIFGSNKLRFGADYSFRDSIFGGADRAPVTYYSKIKEVNAEITFITEKNWQVSATGRNLLNHIEFQNSLDLVSFLGIASRQPLPPRTFSLEVSYKF